ncbi:MAG: hypothetical protein HY898_22420 [Deltaproteobacteria bacterium]|nr:hypothetical protein [Deltaproteobacteria bacterium]
MLAKRLVPCLPIAPGPNSKWEGLAEDLAKRALGLEDDGADEILLVLQGDLHALTGWALQAVRSVVRAVSVTVLAQGGSSTAEFAALIEAGVDKVVVPFCRPGLVQLAAARWGAQTIVGHLDGSPESGAVADAMQAARDGAGELVTSSGSDSNGPDIQAIRAVSDAVPVPVIAGGPIAKLEHVRLALLEGKADGVLLPMELVDAAHGMSEVKRYLAAAGIVVRGVS